MKRSEIDNWGSRPNFEQMYEVVAETFELSLVRGFKEANYKWWCNPPKGWETLDKVAKSLLRLANY